MILWLGCSGRLRERTARQENSMKREKMNRKQVTLLLSALVLLAVALAADTVNYKYDDADRLTSVSYADGTVIAYTYDNAGNMLARTVTPPVQQTPSEAKPGSKTGTGSAKATKNQKSSKPSKSLSHRTKVS